MSYIHVDESKCLNCHRCIAVCPVKFCNNGKDEDHIAMIEDRCINCGRCIDACTHDARYYVDDFDEFISKPHDNLVFIVAPSVAASWGENYKKIIYILKHNLKARKVYDVSFGAEITVMKYLEFIKEKKPKCVISQPCPAIVSYIQKYEPDLIPYLAPVDSPAMATARYLREYDDFKGEIAFLSPCIAKSEEFKDPNTGKYINYNITFKKLDEYFKRKHIDVKSFPDSKYDDYEAERAVNFSRPGGLKETVMRELDKPQLIRKIEGDIVYDEYFNDLKENIENDKCVPLLVDVLNCEKGCNFGPGTLNRLSMDEADCVIDSRINEQKAKYKTLKNFKKAFEKLRKKLNGNPFKRDYNNQLLDYLSHQITDEELQEAYIQLNKYEPDDFKNCGMCGYNSCEKMARAIIYGVNKPENCAFYLTNSLHRKQEAVVQLAKEVSNSIGALQQQMMNIKIIFTEINNSFSLTNDALHNVNNSNNVLLDLSQKFTPIVEAITDISDQTHLLSVNASIEAARAGEAGSGFAIVAQSVDLLSSQTAEEVEKITPMVATLIEKINTINDRGTMVLTDLEEAQASYKNFVDIMSSIEDIMNSLLAESQKLNDEIEKTGSK